MRRQSRNVMKGNHLRRKAGSDAHRSRGERDDSRDGKLRCGSDGDGSATRVPGEKGAFREDGFAASQVAHERQSAEVVAIGRVRTGSPAMPGQIGYEDPEVLVSELLGVERHHLLVGREPVK